MANETESKPLYLEVKSNSQFAKVLQRIATSPVIRAEEVCRMWTSRARGGGTAELTPTRASFLLDLLADATEGLSTAYKPSKGVAIIKGVKKSLLTDVNAKPAVIEKKVIVADEIRGVTTKAEPVEIKATVEASLTPADDKGAKEVEVIWPQQPGLMTAKSDYIEPGWYKLMAAALDSNRHVSLAGPPSVGKSTGPEQYFARKGIPFVTVNGDAGLRRKDLVGTIELSGGTTRFVCAEYAAAAIFGWGVILNEVNAADADALLFLNGQLEVPFTVNIHGRSYPVHPNFRLVVTYNPGLVGTKPLPQAFKDRFFSIKVGFPEESLLEKILRTKGLPANAPYKKDLLYFGKTAWEHHVAGAMRYQISIRRLADTVFLMESGTASDLKEALNSAVLNAVDTKLDVDVLAGLIEKCLNRNA